MEGCVFDISDGYKLLEECYKYYPELRKENLTVQVGDSFSIDIDDNIIYIENKLKNKKFIKLFIKYLKDEFGSHIDKSKIEMFAFFHEIGHCYHKYVRDYRTLDEQLMMDIIGYNETFYKNTKTENFYKYRNMNHEYLADTFAIDMINNIDK